MFANAKLYIGDASALVSYGCDSNIQKETRINKPGYAAPVVLHPLLLLQHLLAKYVDIVVLTRFRLIFVLAISVTYLRPFLTNRVSVMANNSAPQWSA